MANLFETSFVPQQTLLKVGSQERAREPLNFSLIVALLAFFIVLALAGGEYFYKQQTEKQVIQKGQELTAKEKLFDIDKINTYKNLQVTLSTAKNLVDNHTIFSLILNLLELRAAENIGLTSLSYTQDGEGSHIILSGQAPSYEAAYYQVQKWRESKPMMKNVVVMAINLDDATGIVNFNVKIDIDQKTLGYAQMLAVTAQKAPVVPTVAPADTSEPSPVSTSTSSVKANSTTTKS